MIDLIKNLLKLYMIRIKKIINVLFLILFVQCYHTLQTQVIRHDFDNNEIIFELPETYIIENNCMKWGVDDALCYKDSLNEFTLSLYKPFKEIGFYDNDSILVNILKNKIIDLSNSNNYELEKFNNSHIYGYTAFFLGEEDYKCQKIFLGYDKKTRVFFDIMLFTEDETQNNEFKNFINIVKSIRVDTSAQH